MSHKETLLGLGDKKAFISRLKDYGEANKSLLKNASSLDSKMEMTPQGITVCNLTTIPDNILS